MIVHELKTDPLVFREVFSGSKGFEIRYNDRNFRPGDYLFLRETRYSGAEMKTGSPLLFTGRSVLAEVTYLMQGPLYGLKEGWVIMSIKNLATGAIKT